MPKLITSKYPMPEQAPEARIHNFEEVPFGYDEETAVLEAQRCLHCPAKPCVSGCPVGVKIPEFVHAVATRDFALAAKELHEKNNLPAICGRVCPQESQCESKCTIGKRGESVGIGRLERFVADWERNHGQVGAASSVEKTGRRVAVVGGGPAGLTAAADLAKMGHEVVVFEALHAPGGVLMYGIPEFRLPKAIVQAEIDTIKRLGVKVEVDSVVGRLYTVDELLGEERFDAVFLATGAGLPHFMNIPGENLNGVYSANEFLTRVNLMKAYRFPEFVTPIRKGVHVVVVGAGNVAMDSARTALRLGAESVDVVYRRSRDEVPARLEEFHHAEAEGVKFNFLNNPVRISGDESFNVTGVECQRMELGEPDASGRRRPVAVEGSEHVIAADLVVMAIGQSPNQLVPQTTKNLNADKHGHIVVNEETLETSHPGVFAGGDVVTGAATVIMAMGAGKTAARSIDAYLQTLPPRGE